MALEAVVYPQVSFSYSFKDYWSSLGTTNWSYEFGSTFQEDDHDHKGHVIGNVLDNNNIEQQGCWDSSSPSIMQHAKDHLDHPNLSSPEQTCPPNVDQCFMYSAMTSTPPETAKTATTGKRKRRRTKSTKNKEEIENQRMTHIAVERNRRKQMNEFLSTLRSLMPSSYVQRADQASIIGGAINFVKELEQIVQNMEAQKMINNREQEIEDLLMSSRPFSDFFTFPQYTTGGMQGSLGMTTTGHETESGVWAMADIEVTMVERHANLKIFSKKRHKQLYKLVAGLHSLGLTALHLNVTAVHQKVLYSVSVKVEEGCHLNTVDEIAAAVNQLLQRIEEEEAAFN